MAEDAEATRGAGTVGRPAGQAVVRSGLLSMLAIAALGVARLIHGSLVSRNTDHETYAIVGILIGIAMAAGLSLPGGLASAASKFISYQRARGSATGAQAVYRGLRRIGYAWSAVAGIAAGFGAGALLDLSTGEAVAAGALVVAFSLYSVEKAALYGFDRVSSYVRLELLGSGLAVAATVAVIVLGWDGYLWPLILGYTVLIIGATVLLRAPTLEPHGPIAERREITGYVALASLGGLTSFGFLQGLPVLAGVFTTRAEVAQFTAAVTLVGPLYFLPRALGMALFPALARAHGAGEVDEVRRHTDVSTRALLVLLAPIFAVAILVAREVLVLFGGGTYAGGLTVLQLLLIATCLSVTQVPSVNALSSGDPRDVRVPVSAALFGCFTGLVASVPLGHWFGGAGVAVAYLLAVIATMRPLVTIWLRHRMPWAGVAARTCAVVVGAFAVAQVIDATAPGGGARVAIDVGAALVVGVVALVVLRNDIKPIVSAALKRSEIDGSESGTAAPQLRDTVA